MNTIRVLPKELANQIAAGEVVERPASAVKELVENALDAGARRVTVEIEGGGITRISVSDDGFGMNEADARLAIERHATSKLRSFEELGRIQSFGFRGEALPSIASISRLVLATRNPDSDAGTEVVVEGGAQPSLRPLGMPVGTNVTVRDLFYNVPARRKFLRSSGTESGHVTDVLEAAALARPDVTFLLTRDGRPVREWLRGESRAERVAQIVGADDLAHCPGERGPLKLEAFLSRPEHARMGAAGLRILVNDRPVRDRALALTIAQAYGSILERGRYPRGVVYVDIAPELVDVNVHPQKAEVRFADPRAVTDAVYSILSRALSTVFSIPPAPRASSVVEKKHDEPDPKITTVPESFEPPTVPRWEVDRGPPPTLTSELAPEPHPRPEADPWGLARAAPDPGFTRSDPPTTPLAGAFRVRRDSGPLIAVQDSATAPLRPRPEMRWSNLRFVAQLRQTYLVCEADDGLYVLDQHAAAERVTFDRLRKAYRSSAVSSQALLFPVIVDVTPAEAELVEERADEISAVGLDLRVRSPESLSVHGVPKLLMKASPERLVRDLLSEVMKSGGRGFSDAIDLALATMACHGSIRAGDALSPSEATSLLRALDMADFAGHCPHGRPVVTFTSWSELDRRVGRR